MPQTGTPVWGIVLRGMKIIQQLLENLILLRTAKWGEIMYYEPAFANRYFIRENILLLLLDVKVRI